MLLGPRGITTPAHGTENGTQGFTHRALGPGQLVERKPHLMPLVELRLGIPRGKKTRVDFDHGDSGVQAPQVQDQGTQSRHLFGLKVTYFLVHFSYS